MMMMMLMMVMMMLEMVMMTMMVVDNDINGADRESDRIRYSCERDDNMIA